MIQLIGQVLGERYEILEILGVGGMATVYRGQDLLLNRQVAIKILKTEFNTDEEFVRKFKHESQAAAKLSHPNIVNVFDVGYNGTLHYIVMELVNGYTLKDYIVQMGGFMKEEAILNITMQIASALSESHSKDIVHRDIKAQNIMVSDSGAIKVTDFGIARAATTSTLVNTKEIIGSVHYASPEQARGGFVDARSDIYSLGILMYELSTKALPFEADTPVTVALKQIKDELPNPRLLNSDISEGLSSIIRKATAKAPSDRYQSTQALITDLKALRLDHDFVVENIPHLSHETTIIPKITEEDLMNHKVQAKIPQQAPPKKGHRLNLTLTILGALVLAMIVFGIFAIGRFQDIFEVELVEVPFVVGMASEEAVREMDSLGIITDITERRFSNDVDENEIISQSIEAGEMVKKGFTVKLVVSNGGMQTLVPTVKQQDILKAQVMIENEGFDIGDIVYVDNEFPEGMVIEQSPKGGLKMPKGTKIDLTVSKGPAIKTVVVPSLVSKTIREAEVALNQLGLKLGTITNENNDTVEKGKIISHEFMGKEVEKGTEVPVLVSDGPLSTEPDPEPPTDPIETPELYDMRLTVIILTSKFTKGVETVRVEMIQNDKTTVIYNSERSKDEGLELELPLKASGEKGKALIRVYYGDVLAQEQEIEF